jgi:hypothetical protein
MKRVTVIKYSDDVRSGLINLINYLKENVSANHILIILKPSDPADSWRKAILAETGLVSPSYTDSWKSKIFTGSEVFSGQFHTDVNNDITYTVGGGDPPQQLLDQYYKKIYPEKVVAPPDNNPNDAPVAKSSSFGKIALGAAAIIAILLFFRKSKS